MSPRRADPVAVAPAGDIDAFADLAGGCYRDGFVTVSREVGPLSRLDLGVTRTPSFDIWRAAERLAVRHRIADDEIDDTLTTRLNEELFAPGWVSGAHVFERIFTGIVRTTRGSALDAWELFYRNNLRRIDRARTAPADPLHDVAAIYARAADLVPPGSVVLELGACFGFLSLSLARVVPGVHIVASDVEPGTVALLGAMLPRLRPLWRDTGAEVTAAVADATRTDLPDRAVDVALLVHVLEHLDDDRAARAIDEACRLAGRRVIIAVPFEDEATAAYGHLRALGPADLAGWAAGRPGWQAEYAEHHGGWLILDR